MRRGRSGMTLLEVLVAVTLLSILSLGMLMAMRVGLASLEKANKRLMDNRRTIGAQRVLEAELQGFMPVSAMCGGNEQGPPHKIRFFQGEAQSMRFVSAYSLQDAWRGMPQILEFAVIPTEDGKGVRLVVNEFPYTGPWSSGRSCIGFAPDPVIGLPVPQFAAIQAIPRTFVLADRLAYCRFYFQEQAKPPDIPIHWVQHWVQPLWPLGIRVQMAGLGEDAIRIQPITVTAPIHVYRSPEIEYGDY